MGCCSCDGSCCVFFLGENAKLYCLRALGTCCGGIKFDDG